MKKLDILVTIATVALAAGGPMMQSEAVAAPAFDGALISRTDNFSFFGGTEIVWQAQTYEEGGNWWRKVNQPARLYVPPGVSKVRVRFTAIVVGPSSGRVCVFTVQHDLQGQAKFPPGRAATCVNADSVGTTEVTVHSAAIPAVPGEFFNFRVAIPGAGEIIGAGLTWAAIEKVE